MSNNSIIEHRANYYFVELQEDFLLICQQCTYKKPVPSGTKSKASSHCKALILSIMEQWTNTKRGKGGSLSVYMTYKQWGDSMYGLFGRNVIIDSLDELVGERLVAKEPYKMFGKDTFQYYLNHRELNKRIKRLPDKNPDQLLPQGIDPFTSKRDSSETGLLVNATDLLVNAPSLKVNSTRLLVNDDPFTSNHNIDTTKIQNKDSIIDSTERPTAPAIQPTPVSPSRSSLSLTHSKKSQEKGAQTLVSHPSHRFIWFDDLISPSRMIVHLTNAFPHPHYSEMEDKRRERIVSSEIMPVFEAAGIEVKIEWEHETDQQPTLEQAVTAKENSCDLQKEQKLLKSLTDEQHDLWTRCCSVVGAQRLTERLTEHVKVLVAEGVTTTNDLQSLYDYAYARLRELPRTDGKEPTPPHLGTLVKYLPDWKRSQAQKHKEKEEQAQARAYVPGTGRVTNWTQARLKGEAPPINYAPAPAPTSRSTTNCAGMSKVGGLSPEFQEKIRQIREKRAQQTKDEK